MSNKMYATAKLREIRESRELTQQEFADLLTVQLKRGVSRSLVQKWEQGQRNMGTADAMAISRLFNVGFKELVETR